MEKTTTPAYIDVNELKMPIKTASLWNEESYCFIYLFFSMERSPSVILLGKGQRNRSCLCIVFKLVVGRQCQLRPVPKRQGEKYLWRGLRPNCYVLQFLPFRGDKISEIFVKWMISFFLDSSNELNGSLTLCRLQLHQAEVCRSKAQSGLSSNKKNICFEKAPILYLDFQTTL